LIGLDGSALRANLATPSCYGYSRDWILANDGKPLHAFAAGRLESGLPRRIEA
jgi:hypothetical protein